ncbi:hypothetical protein KSX_30600 [Ktedonospora formicarum]|uniref:Uncharacterized protein n=1 Tax=Ktedonospora formicarum TaxID=2778364 RepID=A0A8J3HVN2_9CHLR|nr:hypothetical protein KSX_30600 [Ktedonospora formicarum]
MKAFITSSHSPGYILIASSVHYFCAKIKWPAKFIIAQFYKLEMGVYAHLQLIKLLSVKGDGQCAHATEDHA